MKLRPCLSALTLLLMLPASRLPAAPASAENTPAKDHRAAGAAHLAEILRQPWAAGWAGATLENIRLAAPKADAKLSSKLPAAWQARIAGPSGKSGYLLWEDRREGQLIEFALDDRLTLDSPSGKILAGIPALQQFPIPASPSEPDKKPVASGCVPTAGASVLAFWLQRTSAAAPAATATAPAAPMAEEGLRKLTRQLRGRIPMMTIADRDGFTDEAMDLAGANPADLAKAIQAESEARGLGL